MAEYEISHPRIPQIGNIVLEGPDDLPPPTEKDFWEVVQQQVRPFGLSQLTDEEKISAYKNGFFSEPKPVEGQPEQPGIIDGLLDLGGKAVLRGLQISKTLTGGTLSPDLGIGISGPYDKLLRLPDKVVPYDKTENVNQFREAGKYLFGFLDNTEDKLDFDPVTEALKQTGMKFYSKNKDARGRVKAAAMDYAQDSMVAGMGEGYARAASGGEFLYKGGKFLKDKLLLDEADDSDVLDYVNSSIEFDALNHRYENSAELAAFVLENPQESAKAMVSGLVGGLTPIVEAEDLNEILIDEEDINLDSDLQQDIRSGFVQPDVGVSFLSEVIGDPMNLAGGTLAKAVTAPQRVALAGRISKTLKEVNILNKAKASTIKYLDKLPEQSAMHQRVGSRLVELNAELLKKQKIVDKYARNSLFLRMAAQSSPDELLKVAAKNLDTATDAGKLSMNMVYNAMKPNGKIGLVRKGIAMGAKLTPEIAGATIGASLAGPEGAAAGALAPSVLKGAKILSTMPENVAISYIMRSATEAGEEITEQAARKQYRQFTNKVLYPTGILGLGGGAFLDSQGGGGGLSDSLLKIGGGAFALKFLPKLAQFSDAAMRDSRVIGSELIYARGENSPFFNRLALLPSADEGLIGANADRFQALTRTSSGETILEKAIDKVRPIGRGIATSVKDEFPTGAPFRPGLSNTNKMLSVPTRKVAQFLDRTPALGRSIETLGRFGTVVTAGSTLPAAFGYVGSGGQAEGALAGALVSAPFTSIGAGAGMYQTFKNKGDLFQQKMGDVHYYREHLNKSEQADFDALPMHIRMALSGYSLSHPDVIFQPGTEGQGNFSFNPDLQTSVIEYRRDTGAGLIEGVLAHEIGHKIEIHGLTPMVNKIFFGDPVTKEGGVYGKYNDEGKIEPNQEFLDLRDIYLQKLSADKSIDPANADRYQGPEGNQIFASELFADQVKDYLLSGKKDKGNTVAQKIIRATSDAMLGTPFIRDFLLKMNFPMKADGKFIEGGFFEGKQRRIPEITKLIDQYYKDTRAMRQREIQGEEVTTPGTNRVDKELSIDSRKAKRPIDQGDFESSFSIKDQNDPAIKAKLDTGGVFKWRPTADGGSELETGPTGTPKRYTAKELEKQNRAQGDHAIKVFEKNGVDIITHKDGKKSTGDITNLTPEMIDELAQGPWHPRQIQTLREISRSLREGDGERAGFLIGYFAASTGRKPKAVPFALRQEMPYGFKLTKDGNILALLHDVPQLEKNLKFLKGGKRLPGKYRDEYNQLFDNDTEVWEAFRQYRVNTANGMDGQLGLDDDPARAIRKKNFLNALHGAIDTEHINLNPILSEISKLKGMDMFNPSKRQPFGPATKTFRLDRIFDVTRSGNRNSNVNVDRAKKLLMPTEIQEGSPGSFFRPKSSRDKSAKLRTFKSPVYLKDGSRLSGVADNPEQNPFYGYDKNGQEFSQRREYVNPQDITKSRDSDRTANQIRNELESGQKLFMPASEAGAGKGKQAEGTFDAGERNILFMPSKGDTTPASVQSWDDANPTFGANFTKGMAKDNKEAAALLRKSYEDEFGEPIKAQDFTQEQVEWLGDTLAQEGEAALGRTGNAVNWYTSAVEKALSVAEEIFPEIGQKFEAKDRFLGALSITSQNMRVMDNAKGAVKQYQHKERTGKFDYSIKHGAKADAITSNLKLYDKVEAKMGVDELHAFLDRDFTVKKLTEWGRDFFGDKKFSIAGYSTDKVKGSAIFGPKIGQGFFQNLRGNYDPVTVDLWLRRTYGRLTGLSLDTALSPGDIGRIIYSVRNNKGKRKFAGLEMPDFLKGISIRGKVQKNGVANYKISDKAFETLLGDNTIGRDNYEAIYEFAEKLNREWERSFAKANTDVKKAKDAIKKAKKEKRGTANLEKQLAKFEAEKVAIGKEKPQWAKAGSTVNDKLKPIDVPSNAERAVITKAFNVALKSLKDKGINLTPADLQATLWYPEKDIWAYLKGENSDALNMSYDTAMEVIRDQR